MFKKLQAVETARRFRSSQSHSSISQLSSVLTKPSKKINIDASMRKKFNIVDSSDVSNNDNNDEDSSDGYFLETQEPVYEGCTILTEEALITFPRFDDFHVGKTLCCGCCEFIMTSKTRCSTCNLPMCGPDCKQASAHTDYECKIFTLDFLSQTMGEIWNHQKLRTRVYLLVAVFRCLSLKLKSPYKWGLVEELMKLSSSAEKEKCLSSLENLGNIGEIFLTAKQVVDSKLHGTYPALENPPDHGEMVQVADIVISLACVLTKFSLNAWPGNLHNGMMSLLFTAGRISHDCNPNTTAVMAENGTIKLVAAYNLEERTRITFGRHLSHSDWFLQGFHYRQPSLDYQFLTHEFCSNCTNCSDNNSGIGGVKCSSCNNAFMMPVEESLWRCALVECSNEGSAGIRLKLLQAEDVVKKYNAMRNGLRDDVEKLEEDIFLMQSSLSDSHFIVLALKMEYLKRVRQHRLKSDEFLTRVLHYGEQILAVLNSVMKGLSYYKGLVYFYIHFAHEILLERALANSRAEIVNYHRQKMLICVLESKKNWWWRKDYMTRMEEQEFYALIETHWKNDFCMFTL